MNDFTKFVCFVKGTVITAEVVKASGRELKNEMKMYFNRILADCANFEREVHKHLGPELSELEDDINGSVVGLVWSFFDLPTEDRARFIDHINKFELNDKKEEDGTVQD
jgi:hypothetical protein